MKARRDHRFAILIKTVCWVYRGRRPVSWLVAAVLELYPLPMNSLVGEYLRVRRDEEASLVRL